MKNLWKKWIFIAQFHFPNTDPDPDWQFESGSIRIRNTACVDVNCIFGAVEVLCGLLRGPMGRFQPLPPPRHGHRLQAQPCLQFGIYITLHCSFQNLLESTYKLFGYLLFFYWINLFWIPAWRFYSFFLLFDEYPGILSQFLKSGMGSLMAFEKLGEYRRWVSGGACAGRRCCCASWRPASWPRWSASWGTTGSGWETRLTKKIITRRQISVYAAFALWKEIARLLIAWILGNFSFVNIYIHTKVREKCSTWI